MNIIKNYFSNRTTGFYISFSACILSLLGAITYWLGYLAIDNLSIGKFYCEYTPILLLGGSVLFLVLMNFDFLSEIATPVLWVTTLSAFGLSFVGQAGEKGYMYFTEVFYNGFSIDSLFAMKFGFIVPLILMFLTLILSFIGTIMKQGRKG